MLEEAKRILIVDDDRDVHQLLVAAIKSLRRRGTTWY
jgi:hypothetical protein